MCILFLTVLQLSDVNLDALRLRHSMEVPILLAPGATNGGGFNHLALNHLFGF